MEIEEIIAKASAYYSLFNRKNQHLRKKYFSKKYLVKKMSQMDKTKILKFSEISVFNIPSTFFHGVFNRYLIFSVTAKALRHKALRAFQQFRKELQILILYIYLLYLLFYRARKKAKDNELIWI